MPTGEMVKEMTAITEYNQHNKIPLIALEQNAYPRQPSDIAAPDPDWKITISFMKSRSDSYAKARASAKLAPEYLEMEHEGKTIYTATPDKRVKVESCGGGHIA